MDCVTCGLPIGSCTCADADERLRRVAYGAEGLVAFKWCRGCDKHYARCRCQTPQFFVIMAGQEVDLTGLRMADGTLATDRCDLSPFSERGH